MAREFKTCQPPPQDDTPGEAQERNFTLKLLDFKGPKKTCECESLPPFKSHPTSTHTFDVRGEGDLHTGIRV